MKLNIGCGYEPKEGFINLDKAKQVYPDVVCDIEHGIPYPDNTFDYIYSKHTLEHVRPQQWKFVLEEIYRVAKPNAILELILPFDNIMRRCNYDHYRTFSFGTFRQLYVGNERNYYCKMRLKPLFKEPVLPLKLLFYLFPLLKSEVHYKFKIVKERRQK